MRKPKMDGHGMQLRIKLAAIASAMGLAVGLGVAFAGPAAATNGIKVCVYKPAVGTIVCALTVNQHLAPVTIGVYPGGSPFNAPTSGTGQISLYQSSPATCMELHTNNLIVVDSCQGRASERWSVIVGSVKIGSKTLQAYFYQSIYNPSLCLTSPPADGQLSAATCNFKNLNQEWFFQG
jgi:hypothetical protein